jgi:ABC-type oligopeptide transport system substrate-binding subunit/serine/threonine protein kinase
MDTEFPLVRGYELKEEIGAGAYGVVHRAYQTATGRDVAVKTILLTYSDQPDFAARFDSESKMVARLEHPHIVPLYDTWRDENGAHLVMRLLRGGTLKDLLKTGPMDLEAAVKLFEQLASALAAAHQEGIIHRDFKPSNILFDERGNAYLSDFGIAKNLAAEVTLTPTGAVVGTPDYIAPEQIRGEELTPQADQYSLGLVMYEALTGVHPFAGESIATLFHKHLTEPLPLITEAHPEFPPELDTVIQRATAKHTADRYTSVSEFSTALRLALATGNQRPPTIDQPRIPSFLLETTQTAQDRPPFVAREGELERLTEFLDRVLSRRDQAGDQGSVVFVAGDAGSGKTSLMRAFAERAQTTFPDLLVAWGACNAFTGRGDPYLPFRDILSSLTGDVESALRTGTITKEQAGHLWTIMPQAVSAMLERGPALIDTFVSGSALVERTATAVPEDGILLSRLRQQVQKDRPVPGELEQAELFQQFTNVLCRLADENPILIIIDDLQWADSGSINLLFHLGRRLAGARILIVGAYRPEDLITVEGKRHPLQPLLDRFKRIFGDVWLDLNQSEGRPFVEQFLDTEPNQLSDPFRRTLLKHTDGHPLFTVELLRDLQERGDMVRDEKGRWVEGPYLDWATLPARVEGVIEERIGRLKYELRDILTVAAVEGEDFTAQVVARVQKLQERQLLSTLSRELEKQHQLVKERQPVRVGKRQLSRYRFTHTLFQRYLYNDLGIGERQLLHGEIAELLEELYAGRTEEITVQLARHYAEAGMGGKAATYLLKAGDRARGLYAHHEAIDHYRQALVFLTEQGELERAARTLMKLGLTYHLAFNFRRSRQAFEKGFTLWQRVGVTQPTLPPPPAPHALRLPLVLGASLDPVTSHDSASIYVITQIFSGLVELNLEKDVVPDMARSWEVLDGGRRYIFHLRENVRWSDGVPVTARDFEYAWKRVLHPATESMNASLLFDVKGARAFHQGETSDTGSVGVSAVDRLTLSVELEGPTGYFLNLLDHNSTYPVPQHIVELHGAEWTEVENIVTNGAYRLVEWIPGHSMEFSRNLDFHVRSRGNVQRVVLSSAEGQWPAMLEEYESGGLDRIRLDFLPPILRDRARQRNAEEYLVVPSLATEYLTFDVSRPPFNDHRVRLAFGMTVDQETLANVVHQGYELPAMGGYLPPGSPGHSADIGLPFDPEQARQLLAEAGYQEGADFPVIVAAAWERVQPSIEYLAGQWRETLGIEIAWDILEWVEYLNKERQESYQMAYAGWLADYPDPDSFLRTSGLRRWTHWRCDEFNRLVEQARRITDQQERMRLYRRADRMLLEQAIVIPLTYGQSHRLVKPWVEFQGRAWKDAIIYPH